MVIKWDLIVHPDVLYAWISSRETWSSGFPKYTCKQNCFVKIFDKVNILLNQHPETSLQSWLLCSLAVGFRIWYSIKWTFHWVRAAPSAVIIHVCHYTNILNWVLREVLFSVVGSPRAKGWEILWRPVKKTEICLFSLSRALRTGRKKNNFKLQDQFHFSTWWKSQNIESTLFPSALKIKWKQRH